MLAPDGTRIVPILLDRGRGPEPLFRVTERHGYLIGYLHLEELPAVVDLAALVEPRAA